MIRSGRGAEERADRADSVIRAIRDMAHAFASACALPLPSRRGKGMALDICAPDR